MKSLRPSFATRWLVFSLLAIQTAALPAGLLACACGSEGGCTLNAKGGSADASCCCSPAASTCCHDETATVTTCCTAGEGPAHCGPLSQCACCAAPEGPANRTPPPQRTAEQEVTAVAPAPIVAQLPAVVPVNFSDLREHLFGPPSRGPSVQIAFCTWRN